MGSLDGKVDGRIPVRELNTQYRQLDRAYRAIEDRLPAGIRSLGQFSTVFNHLGNHTFATHTAHKTIREDYNGNHHHAIRDGAVECTTFHGFKYLAGRGELEALARESIRRAPSDTILLPEVRGMHVTPRPNGARTPDYLHL